MKTLKISSILTFLLISGVYGQNLKIGLANQTKTEEITKIKLTRILEEYDVQKWVFTDSIIIADREIPHSHPVLTLNSRPQSDLSLLSTFIHENVHWFLDENGESTNNAIKELKKKFVEVPVGNREGARDEYSTYLHLIVNFLEYDGIRQIAGERAALAIFKRKNYYKWIYKQVLVDLEYLEELTGKHKLKI